MNGIKTFVQKFGSDWTMNLVSMLTYSLITTIIPLLLGILTIAFIILSHLPGNEFNNVVNSINNALPNEKIRQVIDLGKLTDNFTKAGPLLLLVSLVGVLWTGSNVFTNMENGFSVIFRVKDRDFIHQRIMGIGMVIILGLLLPLSLAASALVTAGSSAFQSVLPKPLGIVFSIVGPITSIVILWVLFLVIYRVVPNITVPFRDAWRGAVTAAILFGLLQLLFPTYFKLFLSGNAKYGAIAASLLVLIAWLWFFALITMIGAQVNAVAMGIKPFPKDLPTMIEEEYRSLIAPPPKKQRVPIKAHHVAAAGRTTGAVVKGLGRILAGPARLLALVIWLVTRPFVRPESHRPSGRHIT